MSWSGIFENLVSDIIFLLFTVVIGWIIFIVFHRNKKLEFFGIKKYKRIVVYVANLRVMRKGALGIDNVVRSYEGSAVAHQEMVCANRFRDFFNYLVPSLAEKPNLLSKLLISDVKVEVLISPVNEALLERQASFITLGSPAYNVASKYLQDNHLSGAEFVFGIMPYENTVGRINNRSSARDFLSNENYHGDLAAGTANLFDPYHGDTGTSVPSGTNMNFNSFLEETDIANKSIKSEIRIEGLPAFEQTTYGFIERINDKGLNLAT